MNTLQEAGLAWNSLRADKQAAEIELLEQLHTIDDQIRELKGEKVTLSKAFKDQWESEKLSRRKAQDDAALEALSQGMSAQEVLRQLNNYNTQWIYHLAKALKNGDVAPSTGSIPVLDETTGVKWEHHDHRGVHGYLVDEHRNYVKKYALPGTEFEGEFFVCDMENNFVSGNKSLFESTPTTEVSKRVSMLTQLLEGSYKGKIMLEPTPYKS